MARNSKINALVQIHPAGNIHDRARVPIVWRYAQSGGFVVTNSEYHARVTGEIYPRASKRRLIGPVEVVVERERNWHHRRSCGCRRRGCSSRCCRVRSRDGRSDGRCWSTGRHER